MTAPVETEGCAVARGAAKQTTACTQQTTHAPAPPAADVAGDLARGTANPNLAKAARSRSHSRSRATTAAALVEENNVNLDPDGDFNGDVGWLPPLPVPVPVPVPVLVPMTERMGIARVDA